VEGCFDAGTCLRCGNVAYADVRVAVREQLLDRVVHRGLQDDALGSEGAHLVVDEDDGGERVATGHHDAHEQLIGVPVHRADLDCAFQWLCSVQLGQPPRDHLSALGQIAADPPAQLGVTAEGGDREDSCRCLRLPLAGQALHQFGEGLVGVIGTCRDAENHACDGEQRARRLAVETLAQSGGELRTGRRPPPIRTVSPSALLLVRRHGRQTVLLPADGTARLCTGIDAVCISAVREGPRGRMRRAARR